MVDCWFYLRKSQAEDDDPHILDRHRALLLRTAFADGVELDSPALYEEIGSGELIATRPAFLALLTLWGRLPRNHGGIVYVVELSRLTRGLLSDQGRVEDALMRANIRIRTPSRFYDLRLFEDRLQFHVHGLISNAEHELIKERFARAKREMLLAGLVRNGQVPWGYGWDKGAKQVVTTDDHWKLIRCCQEIQHESLERLAARYGVNDRRLHYALTNPFIAGWPAQITAPGERRNHKGLRMTKRLPRPLWIWPEKVNDTYPHACTLAEWETIQQVLASRRKCAEKTGATEGWCRDVVRFPDSDRRPRLGNYNGPGGEKILMYLIYERGQPMRAVPRLLVHTAAVDAIRAALERPAVLAAGIRDYQAMLKQQALESAPDASAEELMALRDKHRRQAVELLQREMDAETQAEKETIIALRRHKEAEVARLTTEIQSNRRPPAMPAGFAVLLGRLPVLGRYFDKVWTESADAEKREIVNLFLREIRCHEKAVQTVVYQPWCEPASPGNAPCNECPGEAWEDWPWLAAA